MEILLSLAAAALGLFALLKISSLEGRIWSLQQQVEKLTKPATEPLQQSSPASPADDLTASTKVAAARSTEPVVAESAKIEEATPEPKVTVLGKAQEAPDMEKALASRWLVWLGGAAIALGGLLLVKYAHDNGLVPPVARVILGLTFAVGLVAAGEWLLRRIAVGASSFVPSAVTAAGLVIAFGVIYAAYSLYGLLSPALCFPGLMAVGLCGLWLALRQGPMVAALGLVGSYAAPTLVPSEQPSAWGFFAYLLVIVAASLAILRRRDWWWLGYAAIGGAFAWSLLWLNGGPFEAGHVLPIGLFAIVLGVAASLLPRGRAILAADMGTLAAPERILPPLWIAIAGIAAAALVLAVNVQAGLHGPIPLLLFVVGMLALTAFGWLRDGMVAAPLVAALLSFIVLMIWPDVGFHELAFDERGFWVTVPGMIEPPRFRNAVLIALVGFVAAGLAGLRMRYEKLPWAALASGAAVLFLTGAWARAEFTLSNLTWASIGLLLVGVLVFAADRMFRTSERAASLLLAGVALLMLFVLDRLLDGVWQTLAIAALAAGFAFLTRRWPSFWVGGISASLAALAALRLFVGREFWGDPAGLPLGGHWVIYGYGVPAVLFWLASRWLKGEGQGRWTAALEGASLGLSIALVSLELRVIIAGGIATAGFSLLELGAHTVAWLGACYGLVYRNSLYSSLVSRWGAIALLAASGFALLLALTGRNPVLTGDALEGGSLFNSLWLAYLAPAILIALLARKLDAIGLGTLRNAAGSLALFLLMTFVTLWVKRQFQDATLLVEFESQAESYAVSAAWLLSGIGIFIVGLKLARQTIRYGGLAVLVLTVVKVFGFDLFALGGLWRIASMIGLGFCLVGVGWLYTRFLSGQAQQDSSEEAQHG